MSTRRSTSLADRLARMASTSGDDAAEGAEDPAPAVPAERPLKVAPAPADAEDDVLDKAPTEPEAADPTDDAGDERPGGQPVDQPDVVADEPAGEGRGHVQTAQVLASERSLAAPARDDEPDADPAPDTEPEPVAEKAAPRRRKAAASTPSTTDAGATTPAEPLATTLGLHHLAATMERGRNQRRWVEDNLPHRSERGTFMRLPVHLLDVLDEYCDRKDLPQQDFVAAVLDSYFRDLGALPPLGAGHHPDDRFFTELRRQQRSRDY